MSRRLQVVIGIIVVFSVGVALAFGFSGSGSADTCNGAKGAAHHVGIKNGVVQPAGTVRTSMCDTLTITNQDTEAREIAFGPHERHVPYDGVAERVLGKNQSLTITLNKTGTYHWHDHEHDEVEGYFTVTQ